jgi:hypothetical protein
LAATRQSSTEIEGTPFMVDDKKLQQAVDRNEIENLIAISIIARDSGFWADLVDCYHPDASLSSSWFSGKPEDFAKESAGKMTAFRAGETQKHMTGNHWVRVNGDHAISESDLILFQRRLIDGIELDFTTWSRRIHLFEKRNGDWKIWWRTNIYEKDRMDPLKPSDLPQGFYESMDLSKYPMQVRYHCWRNEKGGFPPAKNLCVKGSPREEEVRERARQWIAE